MDSQVHARAARNKGIKAQISADGKEGPTKNALSQSNSQKVSHCGGVPLHGFGWVLISGMALLYSSHLELISSGWVPLSVGLDNQARTLDAYTEAYI